MGVEYEEFVTANSAALMRLAYVLAGDAQRSEDLVQTTLLAAHRRWRRVLAAESAEAYVRRMLVNAHLDWHRRRSSSELPTSAADLTPPDDETPDPAALISDRDELRRLLSNLAPRARTIVVLRYYADLDDRAVGDLLGISASTVRATATRALAALRLATQPDAQENR